MWRRSTMCRRLGRRRGGVTEEHRPEQVVALDEFSRRAVEANSASLHEVRGVGEFEGHVDRLLDENDRHAARRNLADHRQQLLDDHRCETQRQLVDHQQPRCEEKAHPQREHLLLATGQIRRRLVQAAGQRRERLEHRGEPGLQRSLVTAVEPPGRVEVLLDGEPREYAVSTGDLHDAVSRRFRSVARG